VRPRAAPFGLALVWAVAWSLGAAAAVRDARLGSSCDGESPCAPGLTCLDEHGGPETLLPLSAGSCVAALACWEPGDELMAFGGPAGGVCSAPCQYDEECWIHDPNASCWYDGFCHETCSLGSPATPELDDEKCHGRNDMACVCDLLLGCTRTVCSPLCASDKDCAKGFFCHQGTGLCHASKPKDSLPFGAPCEAPGDAACSGVCDLDVVETNATGQYAFRCMRPCVIGAEDACSATGAGERSACITRLVLIGALASAPGDIGTCSGLCACDSDCRDGEVCDPWDLGDRVDSAGVCLPGEREPDAPGCVDGFGGAGGAASQCEYGAVRACKEGDCLGTAICLADGSYSTCECLDSGTPDGEGGAGGAAPEPVAVEDSGCSCHALGSGGARSARTVMLLALLAWALRRGRSRHGDSFEP
jgi:hypothetical protein